MPSILHYEELIYLTNEVGVVTCAGETYVLRAGRSVELLATNDLGERFLASPAISRGRIFLRADGRLFAAGR